MATPRTRLRLVLLQIRNHRISLAQEQSCFIERCRPQGSLNNKVTVVFDGNEDIFGGMESATVKILFSRGEEADDKIKRIVAQAKNPKDIIVVTDDRDIQYAVRALRAKVSSVQSF